MDTPAPPVVCSNIFDIPKADMSLDACTNIDRLSHQLRLIVEEIIKEMERDDVRISTSVDPKVYHHQNDKISACKQWMKNEVVTASFEKLQKAIDLRSYNMKGEPDTHNIQPNEVRYSPPPYMKTTTNNNTTATNITVVELMNDNDNNNNNNNSKKHKFDYGQPQQLASSTENLSIVKFNPNPLQCSFCSTLYMTRTMIKNSKACFHCICEQCWTKFKRSDEEEERSVKENVFIKDCYLCDIPNVVWVNSYVPTELPKSLSTTLPSLITNKPLRGSARIGHSLYNPKPIEINLNINNNNNNNSTSTSSNKTTTPIPYKCSYCCDIYYDEPSSICQVHGACGVCLLDLQKIQRCVLCADVSKISINPLVHNGDGKEEESMLDDPNSNMRRNVVTLSPKSIRDYVNKHLVEANDEYAYPDDDVDYDIKKGGGSASDEDSCDDENARISIAKDLLADQEEFENCDSY